MSYIWVVPDTGGMFGYEDYYGNWVIWKGWTNYPAPWWNRWWWFIDTDDENYGPYTRWWYGEWLGNGSWTSATDRTHTLRPLGLPH